MGLHKDIADVSELRAVAEFVIHIWGEWLGLDLVSYMLFPTLCLCLHPGP